MANDRDQPTPEESPGSGDSSGASTMPWGWLDESESEVATEESGSDTLRIGSSFGKIEEPVAAESFESLIKPLDESNLTEKPTITDSADPKEPRGSIKKLLITAGVLVTVVAVGFFGFMGYDAYQDHKKTEQIKQEEKKQEREKAKAIKEADNPFSVLVGKVDPPSEAPLDAAVADDQLKIGASTLSIRGGTLTATANGCSLVAITDICLGARGKLGNGDFDVLLVKDISRTRLLDDPVEFSELKTPGKTIAASLAIDMGSKEGPARMGVLTGDGTTGFVLIFPEGTSASRVTEVLKAATVI